MLFEVSEESSAGERLQARGVDDHDVGRCGDVEAAVAVSVGALVLARYVAWASGRTVVGDGTLESTGHGWGVVQTREDRGVPDVVGRSDQRGLGQDASATDKTTTLSNLLRWATPLRPSARGSPTWVSRIPESTLSQEGTMPYSLLSSRPWPMKTPRHTRPTWPTSLTSAASMMPSTSMILSSGSSMPTSSTYIIIAFWWLLRPAEYLHSRGVPSEHVLSSADCSCFSH